LVDVWQRGLDDSAEYPKKLDDLMDKKFAIRVKWQTGWGGHATVLQCRDSNELMEKIHEQLPATEETILPFNRSNKLMHCQLDLARLISIYT
jgi:hypothetical protein